MYDLDGLSSNQAIVSQSYELFRENGTSTLCSCTFIFSCHSMESAVILSLILRMI